MSKQYSDLCQRIVDEGHWIENKRTGKSCKTVINADFEYDCTNNKIEIVTTRQSYSRMAIAEFTGYLRGLNSAADFRALGCTTWDGNANETPAWLANPYRKGQDDIGRAYGPQLRDWHGAEDSIDQLMDVYNDLRQGIDNRGEILTFWNPGEHGLGALRPCMFLHMFSIVDGTLYLNSVQRSVDVPLGLNFNMVQVQWFLIAMAHICGLKPGKAFHKLINCHVYDDQYNTMIEQELPRQPIECDSRLILPEGLTMESLLTTVRPEDFKVDGYKYHPAIKYPMSV